MYKCNSLREVEPLTTPVAFFSGFVTETAPTVLTGPKSNEQVFIINKFNRFRQSLRWSTQNLGPRTFCTVFRASAEQVESIVFHELFCYSLVV